MNANLITILGIVLGLVVLSLAFSLLFKKEWVQNVKQTIFWLLKISFLDFVKLIIFIRPWKKYSEQIGFIVWLILVVVTGRYIIITQPKLTDIPGPYIPMIAYIFYLSVLFIIYFVFWVSRKKD